MNKLNLSQYSKEDRDAMIAAQFDNKQVVKEETTTITNGEEFIDVITQVNENEDYVDGEYKYDPIERVTAKQEVIDTVPPLSKEDIDRVYTEADKAQEESILSFVSNIIRPEFITPTEMPVIEEAEFDSINVIEDAEFTDINGEENVMSEEDLELLTNVLGENVSPNTQKLRDIINSDLQDRLNEKETVELKNSLSGFGFGELSEDDAMAIYTIVQKLDENAEYDYYNDIPPVLLDKFKETAKMYGITGFLKIKEFCKDAMGLMLTDIKSNELFDDLQNSMKDALKDMPSNLMDSYMEDNKKKFEETFLQNADEIELEDPERAKLVREMSKAYTAAYTYERQLEFLKDFPTLRKLNKLCKNKYYVREVNFFNDKINRGNVVRDMKNIDDVRVTLKELFHISEYTARQFVILTCLVTRKYDKSYSPEHMFMLSSLSNISIAKQLTEECFIIQNLKNFLELIINTENEDSEI